MGRAELVQGAVVTAVAVLVAVHHVGIWTLVCAGLCLGSAQVVFDNAAQSVLPSLVPQDLLPRANGTQYVVQVIGGSFLGPPVGSALFALAPVAPFALDAASFAGSVALLTGLPRPQPRADKQGSRETGSAGGVTAGVRWLTRHKLLRIVVVMLAVSGFCGQLGSATFVLFATQTLHVSVRGYGLLLASAAAGSRPWRPGEPGARPAVARFRCLSWSRASARRGPLAWAWRRTRWPSARSWPAEGSPRPCGTSSPSACGSGKCPRNCSAGSTASTGCWAGAPRPLGALAGGIVAEAAGLRAPFIIGGILRGAIFLALLPALLAAASPPREQGHQMISSATAFRR